MIYNGAGDPKSQQWTSTISALVSAEAQPCAVNSQVCAFVKISSLGKLNPSWTAVKARFSETNKQNNKVTANGCNRLFLRNKLVQHVK